MFELLMGYLLIGVAILIPLLLLAGVVWAIMDPISLEEVDRRHRERSLAADARALPRTTDSRPTAPDRPEGPRRVA